MTLSHLVCPHYLNILGEMGKERPTTPITQLRRPRLGEPWGSLSTPPQTLEDLPVLRINWEAGSYPPPPALPRQGGLPCSAPVRDPLESCRCFLGLQEDTIDFRARTPLLPSPAESSLETAPHTAPHLTSRQVPGGPEAPPTSTPPPGGRAGCNRGREPQAPGQPAPDRWGRVFGVAEG